MFTWHARFYSSCRISRLSFEFIRNTIKNFVKCISWQMVMFKKFGVKHLQDKSSKIIWNRSRLPPFQDLMCLPTTSFWFLFFTRRFFFHRVISESKSNSEIIPPPPPNMKTTQFTKTQMRLKCWLKTKRSQQRVFLQREDAIKTLRMNRLQQLKTFCWEKWKRNNQFLGFNYNDHWPWYLRKLKFLPE